MIEQFNRILVAFPQNDKSVLFNIEEVMCTKWRARDIDDKMIARGLDQQATRRYYRENAWGYTHALDWLAQEFGPLAKLAVMFNRYNGQVCNGGHEQYYDNGYASQGGGCMKNHGNNTELHDELVALFEQYAEIPSKQEALAVMKDFELIENSDDCVSCEGMGEIEEENEAGEIETYVCDCCCGDGEVDDGYRVFNRIGKESLDTRWYAINDQVEMELEALLAKCLGL